MPDWLPPHWLLNARQLLGDLQAGHYDLLLLARWTLQSVAASLLVLIADLLFGAAILHRLRVRLPARLRGAVAISLGAGSAGLLVFLLGLLRRLDFPWMLGLTIACALSGVPLLRSRRGRWFVFGWMAALRPSAVWLLLLIPFGVIFILDLIAPVMDYDSTMYHMAAVRWYEDAHRLAFHGGIRFNAHPHLPMLLYLRHLLLLGEDGLIKLLNIEFLLVLSLAVAQVARRYRISPAWSYLLPLTSPIFVWMMRVEHPELAMTSWFAVAAVLLAARRTDYRVAGLILGFAAASKLQGLVMAAAMIAAFVIVRRPLLARIREWKPVLTIAAGVVICGAPWWIRSWSYTGSPAAPFFLPDTTDVDYLFRVSSRYGAGHGLPALFLLPWHMVSLPARTFGDPYVFGPAMLILLGAGLAWLVFSRRRPSQQVWFWLLTCVLFFAFWFRTGQVMRYLASVLPLLAMLFAAFVAGLRVPRWILLPLAMLAAVCSLVPVTMIRYGSLPPVTFAEKERFLASDLSYYYAVRELNRVAHPKQRVYLWFCEDAHYYVRPIAYGDWFGDYRYSWAGPRFTKTEQLVANIRSAGFHYILVDRERARTGWSFYSQDFLASGFAQPYAAVPGPLKQLYDDGRYALWQIE